MTPPTNFVNCPTKPEEPAQGNHVIARPQAAMISRFQSASNNHPTGDCHTLAGSQ